MITKIILTCLLRTATRSAALDATNIVSPSPDGFVAPSADWDGLGSAMDNPFFPDKGYRHDFETE